MGILEQLRKVIDEAAVINPHETMMEIIRHFAELGLPPVAILDQLRILGYSMC